METISEAAFLDERPEATYLIYRRDRPSVWGVRESEALSWRRDASGVSNHLSPKYLTSD